MVKIERTNGENAKIAIASLEKEKQKKNGDYNASEIFDAINEIFHGKCYLCEQRGFYQVEHLINIHFTAIQNRSVFVSFYIITMRTG